jgi:hypothetical protein
VCSILTNNYFNAFDCVPENEWVESGERIRDVDPRLQTPTTLTGQQLKLLFAH